MPQVAPLLDVFLALRDEQFPLGVDDFLEISDLVRSGLVPSSRSELLSACQTLWAKSPEEARIIGEFLDRYLPPAFTVADFEELERQAGSGESEPARPEAERSPGSSEPTRPKSTDRAPPPDSRTPGREYRYGAVDSPYAIRLPTGRRLEVDPNIDLRGRFPVSHRQMKWAWRRLRRMRRSGPPIEFDVEATLEQLHRHAVIERLVFVPRRTNSARLLILQDVGGSMTPFQREMRALVDSARLAGLNRLDVVYFHDVPGDVVYRDEKQTRAVALARVLEPFADAGILVVSDGGAARGRFEEHRLERTQAVLAELRKRTGNLAWLNPVPRKRWPGSTASAIAGRGGVAMYPFDALGLTAAVDALRGIPSG